MDRKTRIAVIGAGLGGMTVTGFLQRAGFNVTIYEQAPAFSRIGAGIIISPNVTKVLRRLGIEQRIIDAGIKPHAYISRAWDTGEIMYKIAFDAASEARYGAAYLAIHRGDLHSQLEKGIAPESIAFNHRLVAMEEAPGGMRLIFENATVVEADIVVGADGINSRVREHILGTQAPRFIGSVAHRTIFPTEALDGFKIPDCTKWWGSDRHILAYFMTSRRDEVYVIGVVPRADWEVDAAMLPGSREELMANFAKFHPDLLRVIEAATEVTVWPIYDREPNDRWSAGRVVLLGDACHPMRPFMGAGGAMAIEDGAILSRCLVECEEPLEAFRQYEATRVERVGEVQRLSVENSWMRGPGTDTNWFYLYDACVAPPA